jgi:hypothetical protein
VSRVRCERRDARTKATKATKSTTLDRLRGSAAKPAMEPGERISGIRARRDESSFLDANIPS